MKLWARSLCKRTVNKWRCAHIHSGTAWCETLRSSLFNALANISSAPTRQVKILGSSTVLTLAKPLEGHHCNTTETCEDRNILRSEWANWSNVTFGFRPKNEAFAQPMDIQEEYFAYWAEREINALQIQRKNYHRGSAVQQVTYSLPSWLSSLTGVPPYSGRRTVSPVLTSQEISAPSFVFAPGPVATTTPEFTCCAQDMTTCCQWPWSSSPLRTQRKQSDRNCL
jgi:hypothetical protein